MYTNKIPTKVVPKGTLLNEVFPAKTLDNNEFINILYEGGATLVYKGGDFFNSRSYNWIRTTKITIKYDENIIDIEEVFSHLYQRCEDNFKLTAADYGC